MSAVCPEEKEIENLDFLFDPAFSDYGAPVDHDYSKEFSIKELPRSCSSYIRDIAC